MEKVNDKSTTLHVYAGILIVILTGVILTFCGVNAWWSVPIGLATGVLAGFAKEFIWDRALGNGVFNWNDIIATSWGSLVGTVILIFIVNFIF